MQTRLSRHKFFMLHCKLSNKIKALKERGYYLKNNKEKKGLKSKVRFFLPFLSCHLFVFSCLVYGEALPPEVEEARKSIVQVRRPTARDTRKFLKTVAHLSARAFLGTGFFVNQNTLVTNFHVIFDPAGFSEWFSIRKGNRNFRARLTALSAVYDVAILEVADWTGPFLNVEDLASLSEEVYVIGFPQERMAKMKGRNITMVDHDYEFLTDFSKKLGGASGSPLLNNQGESVGLVYLGDEDRHSLVAKPRNLWKGLIEQIPAPNESFSIEQLLDRALKEFYHFAKQEHYTYTDSVSRNLGFTLMFLKENIIFSQQHNDERIIKWWRKATEGQPGVQYKVGSTFLSHKNISPRIYNDIAIEMLEKAAKNGGPDIQSKTGWVFKNHGDYKRAVKYLEQAAAHGNYEAKSHLGMIYFTGFGSISQDYGKAAGWWKEGVAQKGSPEAQYAFGKMYFEGLGVPQNYEQAFKWIKKAAEQKLSDSYALLGKIYFEGLGVPQDYKQAAKWWRKIFGSNDADVHYQMGLMYYEGRGVKKSYKMAVKWWKKAAARGYVEAQYKLGLMYVNGWGIPQNREKAVKWWKEAAEQGHIVARNHLENITKQGYPSEDVESEPTPCNRTF